MCTCLFGSLLPTARCETTLSSVAKPENTIKMQGAGGQRSALRGIWRVGGRGRSQIWALPDAWWTPTSLATDQRHFPSKPKEKKEKNAKLCPRWLNLYQNGCILTSSCSFKPQALWLPDACITKTLVHTTK